MKFSIDYYFLFCTMMMLSTLSHCGNSLLSRRGAAVVAVSSRHAGSHIQKLAIFPRVAARGVSTRSVTLSLKASKEENHTSGTAQADDASHLSANDHRSSFTIFYNDVYEVNLPPNHRFPMAKYGKVRRRVEKYVHEQNYDSTTNDNSNNNLEKQQALVDCRFLVSPLATTSELTTTHCPEYVQRYLRGDMTPAEERNVGFPWSPASVNRSLSSVGGTVEAARCVVRAVAASNKNEYDHDVGPDNSSSSSSMNDTTENDGSITEASYSPKWAAHVAGGTHHAFYDYGEGFCVFSDIAVAANVVLREFPKTVKRILILDLDVHQGNGNAVLFAHRPEVFTFSMQCSANYFSKKETSDLDIELPPGSRDETYLLTLRHWLSRIQKEAGDFDLVFFQGGVDCLDEDRLGRLSLTAEGLRRRNAMVYEFCYQQRIPLVICMGGGYPRHDWEPILDAHANVYTQAYDFLVEKQRAEENTFESSQEHHLDHNMAEAS